MKLYTIYQLLKLNNEDSTKLAKANLLEKIRYNTINYEDFNIAYEDNKGYVEKLLEDYGIDLRELEVDSQYGVSVNIKATFNRDFAKEPSELHLKQMRNNFIRERLWISKEIETTLPTEEISSMNYEANQYIEEYKAKNFFNHILTDAEQQTLYHLEDILDIIFEPYIFDGKYNFNLEPNSGITGYNQPIYKLLEFLKETNSPEFPKYELEFLLTDEDNDDNLEDIRDEVEEIVQTHFDNFVKVIENKGTTYAETIHGVVHNIFYDMDEYFEGAGYWIDRIENIDVYDFDEYLFNEDGIFICESDDIDSFEVTINGVEYTYLDFELAA